MDDLNDPKKIRRDGQELAHVVGITHVSFRGLFCLQVLNAMLPPGMACRSSPKIHTIETTRL